MLFCEIYRDYQRAKWALSIIWPGISYDIALEKAALSTLSDRRAVSCIKFIGKVRPGNPLYPLIHNRVVPISTSVCLRCVREF